MNALARRILDALPQTQCTRCGYPDCAGYAQAIAAGEADINQCPPGGAEGILRLADLTGRKPVPLNPAIGVEGPRMMAVIDENWCIGCTPPCPRRSARAAAIPTARGTRKRSRRARRTSTNAHRAVRKVSRVWPRSPDARCCR